MLRENSMVVHDIAAENRLVPSGGEVAQEKNSQDNLLKPSFSKLTKEEKEKLYSMIQKSDMLKRQWLKSNEVNP